MCATGGEANVPFPHLVEVLQDWRVLMLGVGAGHCVALAEKRPALLTLTDMKGR